MLIFILCVHLRLCDEVLYASLWVVFLLLSYCLPIKRVFIVNQKVVWFIAIVVGSREYGVWLLNRCWVLFEFNEVKKRQVN